MTKKGKNLTILGIETSCDDTCAAVLQIKKQPRKRKKNNCFFADQELKLLSNLVSSQVKWHAPYGGVYPSLAKRKHQQNLPLVLKKILKAAASKLVKDQKKSLKLDLIAVTVGPGLEPCLWTGVNFAQALAKKMKLPLIPINHLEAHLLANWLPSEKNCQSQIINCSKIFPAVCLLVSGGHTQLILIKKIGDYKLIGETRDDAAGECFDKTARILGLTYPGGPVLAALAARFKKSQDKVKINLPRPMLYQKNYDFSFSGLKTAVLYDFKQRSPKIRKSKQYLKAMAAETQQAIIEVLLHKTLKAAKDYKANSIILSGGVAANQELRQQFESKIKNSKLKMNLFVPAKIFCTDNAAMTALAGYFNFQRKKDWPKIKANANLKIDQRL